MWIHAPIFQQQSHANHTSLILWLQFLSIRKNSARRPPSSSGSAALRATLALSLPPDSAATLAVVPSLPRLRSLQFRCLSKNFQGII